MYLNTIGFNYHPRQNKHVDSGSLTKPGPFEVALRWALRSSLHFSDAKERYQYIRDYMYAEVNLCYGEPDCNLSSAPPVMTWCGL